MKAILLLLGFVFPLAAEESVRTYSGTVVVRASAAADAPAMIAIDQEVNGVADGIADVVYLFYRESGWSGSPMAARRAHVEDRGGKQLVITSGGRRTVFSVADVPVTRTGADDAVHANGLGLARYWRGAVTRIQIDPRTLELTHVCDEGAAAAWCPE